MHWIERRLWDTSRGVMYRLERHEWNVHCFAFCPLFETIFSGGREARRVTLRGAISVALRRRAIIRAVVLYEECNG